MKRHTVLIPLDGSQFSREIVPHVLRRFAPEECRLILLRVGHMPHGLIGASPRPIGSHWPVNGYTRAEEVSRAYHPIYSTQEEESERARLIDSEHALKGMLEQAGYEVRVIAQFGDPAEEIIATIRQIDADFVAMAIHGRQGFRAFLPSGISAQVLRRSSVPVLLFQPLASAAQPVTTSHKDGYYHKSAM